MPPPEKGMQCLAQAKCLGKGLLPSNTRHFCFLSALGPIGATEKIGGTLKGFLSAKAA